MWYECFFYQLWFFDTYIFNKIWYSYKTNSTYKYYIKNFVFIFIYFQSEFSFANRSKLSLVPVWSRWAFLRLHIPFHFAFLESWDWKYKVTLHFDNFWKCRQFYNIWFYAYKSNFSYSKNVPLPDRTTLPRTDRTVFSLQRITAAFTTVKCKLLKVPPDTTSIH